MSDDIRIGIDDHDTIAREWRPIEAAPKTVADFEQILAGVSYKEGWAIAVWTDGNRPYLQVICEGRCNVTGKVMRWTGRKWMLSPHLTKSEVVQTAFKAVLTAEEHECRETFKYRGESIFDPHFDVDALVRLRGSAECLDERPDPG